MVQTQLKDVTDSSVTLSTGETIPCRTVCWTAGVESNPVARALGLPLDRDRISCNAELRVAGFDNVWALGDIAAVPDPARPGQPCPPTAQHAIRQGKLLANNVAAVLGYRSQVKPFRFKTLGAFADLGRHNAVANLMGVRVRGFPAWAIARFYHLAWIPGFLRKLRLIVDWTVDFWFKRDTADFGQLLAAPRMQEHVAPAQGEGGPPRAKAPTAGAP
jgi:NADH dehydrogenase